LDKITNLSACHTLCQNHSFYSKLKNGPNKLVSHYTMLERLTSDKHSSLFIWLIWLYHPLDGVTNPRYKLLHFSTITFFYKEKKALAFNRDRCCHLALCLQLILFHLYVTKKMIHSEYCPRCIKTVCFLIALSIIYKNSTMCCSTVIPDTR
jgi:hypothetical protein